MSTTAVANPTPTKTSFWSKVEGFFSKLFGKTPSVLQRASSAISFAAPLLNLILEDTAGQASASEVSNIVAEVQTDMATTSALISQSHNSTDATVNAKVQTGLTAITGNLSTILAAGHVKNQNTVNEITAGIQELQAVITALAQSAA